MSALGDYRPRSRWLGSAGRGVSIGVRRLAGQAALA